MSSGNNGEGMGVRFVLAEWAFGLGWKSCSGRNDAEWAWVSYESSSSTELRHHACVEHCTDIVSPHLPSPRSLVRAWSLRCARSLCHWNLCLWLPRNECLASKYPRGCRSKPFLENECWLPDIAAQLPEVLPALCKTNFKSCSGICLKKIQQTKLEKRKAAVMWVNTESDHLCHAFCALFGTQPHNEVVITCLLVLVGGSSIRHRLRSWETLRNGFSALE